MRIDVLSPWQFVFEIIIKNCFPVPLRPQMQFVLVVPIQLLGCYWVLQLLGAPSYSSTHIVRAPQVQDGAPRSSDW